MRVDITAARCVAHMLGCGGESPEWPLCQSAHRVDRSPANLPLEAAPGWLAPSTSSYRPDPTPRNGQSLGPHERGRPDQAASGREARDSNRKRARSDAELSFHLVRGMGSPGQMIRDPFVDSSQRLIAQFLVLQRQRRQGRTPRTSSRGQGLQNPRCKGGLSIRESIHQVVELFSGCHLHESNLAHPSRPDPMVTDPKRRRRTAHN